MKKVTMLLTAILLALPCVTGAGAAQTIAEREAVFVDSVVWTQEEGEDVVSMRFTQPLADAERDVLASCGKQILVNGRTAAEWKTKNESVSLFFRGSGDESSLEFRIPKSENAISGEEKLLIVKKGFSGGSDSFVTTVDLRFRLGELGQESTRIFRSSDPDDYETVELLSVSAPRESGKNVSFLLTFSKSITVRQLTDMQRMTKAQFLTGGLTEAEVELYYDYGLITNAQPESLLYKIQYGCLDYNGSKNMDDYMQHLLTPQAVVDEVQVFNVSQIQKKVDGFSPTSQRMLVVQIHLTGNTLEFILKGDSADPQYNIAPALDQAMVFRLTEGLLFPNGTMLKQTVTFEYDPDTGRWTDPDLPDEEWIDDTVGNQGGYTDAEIAQMKG